MSLFSYAHIFLFIYHFCFLSGNIQFRGEQNIDFTPLLFSIYFLIKSIYFLSGPDKMNWWMLTKAVYCLRVASRHREEKRVGVPIDCAEGWVEKRFIWRDTGSGWILWIRVGNWRPRSRKMHRWLVVESDKRGIWGTACVAQILGIFTRRRSSDACARPQ